MTPLAQVLDVDNLDRRVAEGMIARKEGPGGLTLFDYTQRAQWSKTWDRETLMCRGLVVRDGLVQSRPFGKFFNLSEHASPDLPPLPLEPFEVFEKVDGSLIIASNHDGHPLLTTRGSFASTQAIAAKELWDARYGDVRIPDGETWLFEYVAPWNRIVVGYDFDDLVLLARIDNATGQDLPLPEWPGRVVRRFDGLDFDAIAARMLVLGPDEEGYVLRFQSGMRAKAKGAEYVRLHRLLTGVSARTIWECLANGSDIAELVDRVPDEFYAWVTATVAGLRAQYDAAEVAAFGKYVEMQFLPSRKDQAIALQDFAHKAVVFRMLDSKPHAECIWKTLRPSADRPFVEDDL